MSSALLLDLYELTMASSYVHRSMTAPATFSLFVRRLPPERGFLVAAGLEPVLAFLEEFRFDEEDLSYLRSLEMHDQAIEAFSSLRFTGDVWAVPEGTIVFADEPIVEVTAPLPEAQLVETVLLNKVSFNTAVASKAARCIVAAQGRIELVDFGMRRSQGLDAALDAARTSAMVGFGATSNVEAARRYGLVASGTMAHSYIEAFVDEVEAFRAFGTDHPERATFLVDTYDTLSGVRNAIHVIRELHLEEDAAIRLDSGDLSSLAFEARRLLDQSGLASVKIVVSGTLDEQRLARLVADGAPIDAAGVGTRMSVSADAPYLDSAYKLVSYGGKPTAKFSTGKATYPGAKQIFRRAGFEDILALREESPPEGYSPLLEPVMENGRRRRPPEALVTQQARFRRELSALADEARRLDRPVPPTVEPSADLKALTDEVRRTMRGRIA